jgi:hypothetical protein
VPAHRGKIAAACLTILRAYHVTKRPMAGKLTVFGRFENWSAMVREPLVWLGQVDPCDTRRQVESRDPVARAAGGSHGGLGRHIRQFVANRRRGAADCQGQINSRDARFVASQCPERCGATWARAERASDRQVSQ